MFCDGGSPKKKRLDIAIALRSQCQFVLITSLRNRMPLFVLALALLVVPLLGVAPAQAETASAADVIEQQFLAQVNTERAARGLAPVSADKTLRQASERWSDSMASKQTLVHSTDGRAEIIARGYWSGQITDAWMNSSSHRNLIVDPNLYLAGVGVTCDANGQIWATIQFERLNTNIATLRTSSVNPIATPRETGSGCNDERYIGGVMRLYEAFFRRASDQGGLAYWMELRSNGTSLDQIADVFVASAEFQQTYGSLDNRGFVDLIYKNVLQRPADGEGYDYWLSLLNQRTLSRGQLMVQFSDSAEFQSLTGIRG